jgi:G3E family GTPase
VVTLSDEELTYVEWLLDKADSTIDEILIEQSGLIEAKTTINQIMTK